MITSSSLLYLQITENREIIKLNWTWDWKVFWIFWGFCERELWFCLKERLAVEWVFWRICHKSVDREGSAVDFLVQSSECWHRDNWWWVLNEIYDCSNPPSDYISHKTPCLNDKLTTDSYRDDKKILWTTLATIQCKNWFKQCENIQDRRSKKLSTQSYNKKSFFFFVENTGVSFWKSAIWLIFFRSNRQFYCLIKGKTFWKCRKFLGMSSGSLGGFSGDFEFIQWE